MGFYLAASYKMWIYFSTCSGTINNLIKNKVLETQTPQDNELYCIDFIQLYSGTILCPAGTYIAFWGQGLKFKKGHLPVWCKF